MLNNLIATILFTLSDNVWSVIKIVAGFLFGGLGLAIFNKQAGKKEEAMKISNMSTDGANLLIQVKTNIDKVVTDRTAILNAQITELQKTILATSIKYARDLDQYVEKMGEIENRLDTQGNRTAKAEDRNNVLHKDLDAEIILRKQCIAQLENLQRRVYELEKISYPTSNQEKDNPENKENTLKTENLQK